MEAIVVSKDTKEDFDEERRKLTQIEGYLTPDNFLRIILEEWKMLGK